MFKLMKYEYRRSFSLLIFMFAALIALEGLFLYGLAIESKDVIGVCIGLMFLCGFGAYLILILSGVVSLDKDLKNKEGYLVFMAPISNLKIVCAKLISTLLVGLTFLGSVIVLFILDYGLCIKKFDLPDFINILGDLIQMSGFEKTKMIGFILYSFIMMLIIGYFLVIISDLAIAISSSILVNNKMKGLASFGISLLIFVIITKLSELVPNITDARDIVTVFDMFKATILKILYFLVVDIAGIIATAKVLDKKLSL